MENPTLTATCIECDAQTQCASDTQVGEIISCDDCQVELEVTGLEGGALQVEMAPEEEEDWGE